ncbi:MAG TPA: glycosyltransferase family 2 protein [Marinilabiliaceae bacterium]|nr:glycosyltransferase family 2 protein [Marinilabiliaceae bacterium]
MEHKKSVNNPKVLLSVVIVSYNCLSFLRLCLDSLLWLPDDRMEIFVVDNNSNDATVEVLRTYYPKVKVIANEDNVGFGRACNQAISQANGDYYLMLNPDTIVDENLVDNILSFMKQHPQCGGMGAYMTDGKGEFLLESKRGLPTLFRSFCRFSGITRLFPRSSWLAGYYMGHLSIHEVNEVEILSGAFMVLRAQAVKKCGAFDERFFMYGEDIDLSWRLVKGGYKNYYNPMISIIHFKGESTVKDARYVKIFFGAMALFYDIHFNSGINRLMRPLVFLFTQLMSKIKEQQLKRKEKNSWVEKKVREKNILVTHDSADERFDNSKEWEMIKPHDTKDNWITTWMDMATLKPSEAIWFVQKNGMNIPQLVWLDSRREEFFKVISSEENTVIGLWKQN